MPRWIPRFVLSALLGGALGLKLVDPSGAFGGGDGGLLALVASAEALAVPLLLGARPSVRAFVLVSVGAAAAGSILAEVLVIRSGSGSAPCRCLGGVGLTSGLELAAQGLLVLFATWALAWEAGTVHVSTAD